MLIKTRGIVLQQFKYSDSSLIVKIYTEELGLQSYMVKGSRSKKSTQKPAYFQPLSLIDLVVYHKENKQLHAIKEITSAYAWKHIPFNVEKQAILLFLDEMLYKTLREESPNQPLFNFIYNSLHWFDLEEKDYLNFHLFFLLQISRFLGFYPKLTQYNKVEFFDLQEGIFLTAEPVHPYYSTNPVTEDLLFFLHQTIETSKGYPLSTFRRRNLLETLISYYQLHLPEMGTIKSLEVLTAVLH